MCIEARELIDNGIMSQSNYNQMKSRGQFDVVRSGGGVGRSALISYRSLPVRFQQAIEKYYGASPYDIVKTKPISSQIETDYKAFEFFSNYRYEDGSAISCERQNNILLWANNASVLNTLRNDLDRHTHERAKSGKKPLYSNFYANKVVFVKDPEVQHEFENNLPVNPRRLRAKLEDYIAHGYDSLIKQNKGNANALKVNKRLEMLILSLYSTKTKPYAKTVHKMFGEFMEGKITIVDKETGEMFQPSEFMKKGKAIDLSITKVWQIVNQPANRVIVDKIRNDAKYYKDRHEPHHHRKRPEFSLSKISMDDRDIPNSAAKTYYAFDVMSGAIIGRSYSKDKDMNLVFDCFANMFAFLDKHNLGSPMEIEVEQHLMNRLTDSILAEGLLFQYIRWCAPGNSQEKWAEYGIRQKKLQQEKYYQEGIGRFYSKLEANRPPQVGEWGSGKMRIKDRKRSYEKAVAEDLYTIEKHNAAPHPLIKGKSRLEVFLENANPKAGRLNKALLAKLIGAASGNFTKTSIKRSQSVTVQYNEYQLPHPAILAKLKPNNKKIEAYYLPNPDGTIDSVYLYQDDTYICECKQTENYSTARAEWGDSDAEALVEQSKYVATHRKMVKDGRAKIAKITIIENDEVEEISEDAKDIGKAFVPSTIVDDDLNNGFDDFDDDFDDALSSF